VEKVNEIIKTDFGEVEVIKETKDFQIAIITINPKAKVPLHYHNVIREVETILEGEVLCNGKVLKPGDTSTWELGVKHEYENKTDGIVKLLCVSFPPYDPKDEVRV